MLAEITQNDLVVVLIVLAIIAVLIWIVRALR
jgi:preprotein translocase subunit SecE